MSMSPDALMMDVSDEHLTGAPPEGHGESPGVVSVNKSNMGVQAYHASLHKNGGPVHNHRAAPMSTTDLYRAMPGDFELRKEGSGMPTMFGHFTPIGQWARISSEREGEFMERSAPGAFDESLTHQRPKVLFNHGKDPSIGNKVLGTPRMVNGDASFEVPLYDTSYNRDLLPGIAAGEYGVSYRFSVQDQEVVRKPKPSDYNPEGLPERTILKATVPEFGPVTFPAYAGADVGVRSLTDDFRPMTFEEELTRWAQEHPSELAKRISVAIKDHPAPKPVAVAPRFQNREEWQRWLST